MNDLFLLQKTFAPGEIANKIFEPEKKKTDFSRIRCPLCKWQPRASDRWMCTDSGFPEFFFAACGAVWNTFETRGRCPGCRHQWRYTSCLRCGEFSPHASWYENNGEW